MNHPQRFDLDHTQQDPLLGDDDLFPSHPPLPLRSVTDVVLEAVPEGDAKEEYSPRPMVPPNLTMPVSLEVAVEQQDGCQCVKCGNYNSGRNSRCSACQGWNGDTRDGLAKSNDDQTDWECECGNIVGAKKTRCGSCQKWRGGKRKRGAKTGHNISPMAETVVREDWICDSCGHSNGHSKVRCVACPRWKDGKRPNMKLSVPLRASDLAVPNEATLAVVASQGNWICHGCEAVNLGQKARCRICQSWKGGRRQNMPMRDNPVPSCDTQVPWDCDGCGHTNGGVKLRCGSCQHWRDGRRLNMRAKNHKELPNAQATSVQQETFHNLNNTPWQCLKCSQNNEATKLRCGTCKSWKNGKQKQLFSSPPPRLVPLATEAVAPWVCIGCNHLNAGNNTRCDNCQCWKDNGNIQHSGINVQNCQVYPHQHQTNQADHSNVGLSAAGLLALDYAEPSLKATDGPGAQHLLPWVCPRCNRENLGSKARCGGCQKWKGGIRENYKSKKWKVVADPWTCHRCNMQNAANKVRCKACQCWKDGGRPDVLARNELAKQLKSKVGDWWPCDKCHRRNKPKNQRCGGCQRWRDGSRPQMRKKPAGKVTQPTQSMPHLPLPSRTPNECPQYKMPVNHYLPNQNEAYEYPSSTESSWTCDKCSFSNLPTETTCTICEEPKPGGVQL